MSHGSERFAYLGREIAVRTHRLAEAWRDLASVSWLAVTRRDCLDDSTGRPAIPRPEAALPTRGRFSHRTQVTGAYDVRHRRNV